MDLTRLSSVTDGCRGTQTRQTDRGRASKTERQNKRGDQRQTYQKKLGELAIAELLVSLCAKVQLYELTVPVEGDVLVDGGLAKDLLHILCRGERERKKQKNNKTSSSINNSTQ